MPYCVDTSGWLDGWQRNYPPDVFPTLWNRAEFPRLVDTLRNRSKADPFVIATAIDRKATVVTGEPITGSMTKPRIPDVCDVRGVRCINFLQMIRELNLTF